LQLSQLQHFAVSCSLQRHLLALAAEIELLSPTSFRVLFAPKPLAQLDETLCHKVTAACAPLDPE